MEKLVKKLKYLFGVCVFFAVCGVKCDNDISIINSDEIIFQKEGSLLNGNVVIVYYDRVVAADRVVYSSSSKRIEADGNVVIKDKKGNVFFFDSVVIENNFCRGEAKNIKIIMPDKSRLAADFCKIRNKKFELRNVVYSPCYECTESGQLTWQIKSSKVFFDPEDQIEYENAKLEAFGVPILYTPYLSQPGTKLKKKSGLLAPKFSSSSLSGFSILPKYLVSISNSQELILKPIITSKIGTVGWIYYGNRFKNGEFSLDASVTGASSVKNYSTTDEKEKKAVEKIQNSGYRGHFFSKLNYEINKIWRCGFDINLTSDRYYLKRFPFFKSIHNEYDRTLESNVKAEGFDGRNYTCIKAAMFQSEHSESVPKILPVIERNYSDTLLEGSFAIDTIFMNLLFKEAKSAQKAMSNISWGKKFLLAHGNILDFKSMLLLKAIGISEKEMDKKNTFLRATPMASLCWKWPLLIKTKIANVIFTPMVGIIIAGNKKYFDPFEDPFREITDINFLDCSRSPSSYNIDSGNRICYGMKASVYKKNGENLAHFTIGRSTELKSKNEEWLEISGLGYRNSNIVMSSDIFLSDELKFVANGSYSSRSKRWTKFESGLKLAKKTFDLDVLAFNGKQCFFDPFTSDTTVFTESNDIQKYKGIMFDAAWKASNKWKLKAGLVLGDKNNSLIKHNIGFVFSNECTQIETTLERTNYKGGDLKPETSLRLIVHLKNIGI